MPGSSPPELANQAVSPTTVTDCSIDTFRSPTSARSCSSQPAAWNTTRGATVTRPSGPYARFNAITWNRLFSPPSTRWSCSTSGEPSQSLFQSVGPTSAASSDQSSVASGRSIARIRSSLSREPTYTSGKPSGSTVTEPLMMSPVGKSGRMRSPVCASTKCTRWSYAPNTSHVRPSRSNTAG
ncbi:MAG: hypothetical protein KatS3mg010_0401 [Acidimicrobiia bacterium]|nr:MAG: hypothetical protein KatS3mg010_0401 [Acidimicrobiia bacterium]